MKNVLYFLGFGHVIKNCIIHDIISIFDTYVTVDTIRYMYNYIIPTLYVLMYYIVNSKFN